jgi:hypothetical protein
MMNFGLAEAQIVEFPPALPNHGAFFFRTHVPAGLVLEPVMRLGSGPFYLCPK